MATFFIQQFGCRATQADGAALERQLLDRGCTPAADAGDASIVVVNTCTVTAAADAQARDAIRKLHARNPAARVIVTGCYAQRAPEELAELPGVSWVVGNSHKAEIPNLVQGLGGGSSFVSAGALTPDGAIPFHSFLGEGSAGLGISGARKSAPVLIGDIFAPSELLSAPLVGGEAGHTRPTVKIQDGCNLRCAYCVIPYVRGKSRSLAADEVLREIRALTSREAAYQGQEIVLSGINLGTYGRDLMPRTSLIDLLRRILDETLIERLRLSSIEPQDVTQDLVELFASTERLAAHFHVPLQSGSDRILAAMHRRYRTAHYARRIELIRERLPNAGIGADVIAGFPGESDEDHEATVAFIEARPCTYLHVFSFSARPGTPAASLPKQVPPQVVKARARELRALGEAKAGAFRREQVGRTLRVLTLQRGARDESRGVTPAMSSNYLEVEIEERISPNQWRDVVFAPEKSESQPRTDDAKLRLGN